MAKKTRDRCCVAVPLYNVGIYAIFAQFAVIALVTGVLSFAAPYIVAVSIPSFGAYILGACCLIVFGLQGWGFFGVYKEKPGTYRKYVHVNMGAVALTFVLALVWIIVSAVKHNTAVTACIEQFVTETENSGTSTSASDDASLIDIDSGAVSGSSLCSIFTWVQTGIMGGLWLALLIIEVYFVMMSRAYSREQRLDHQRYNSIYTEQRQSYIRQSMVWDRQASLDGNSDPTAAPPGFAAHGRSFSSVSKSSNLRNEVKVAGDHDEDEELVGDTSYSSQISPPLSGKRGGDGYVDAGLYASGSPTKQHGYQNSMNSTYSAHQHANSRSNLAPENTSPAYRGDHQRNRSNLSMNPANHSCQQQQQQQQQPQQTYNGHYQQQQYAQPARDSRYEDAGEDEFTSYYTR